MAGRTSTPNPSANNNGVKFKVKKPLSNSAREIRDAILRDYFGYTESDIKELDAKMPGKFFICVEGGSGNQEMTPDQVKGWMPDPADGMLLVPLNDYWITNLTAFREQRASFEAFKVGMFISDVAVRKLITDDLENIFLLSGERRIAALDDLMATITTSNATRDEIYKALRFLTNESGYKGNPFLLIALAATTCSRSDTPVFRYPEVTEAVIAAAVKAANDSLYGNSKTSYSTINTQEAARINLWGATLYDNINVNYEARNRRWIERFLSMSDNERRSLKAGDIIPLENSNQNSIRAPFESEKRLQNTEKRYGEKVDLWNKTDSIGQDQSFTLPADHHQSDYFQSPNDTFDKEGFKVNKQRAGQKRPRVEPNLVPNNYNPYRNANIPADAYGAVLYLFLEGQKYNKANMRMNVVANYLNKKRELENQIAADNLHTVPPPPAVIEKYIKDFRRDGRITADTNQKVKIVGVLSELERLLEESNAFYKSRK